MKMDGWMGLPVRCAWGLVVARERDVGTNRKSLHVCIQFMKHGYSIWLLSCVPVFVSGGYHWICVL